MRVPRLRGVIERRMLVNFRVEPEVLVRQLPAPFEPKLHNGRALVGICLIRLRGVRPMFLPEALGIGSENAAHRAAVVWTDAAGLRREGVYVRRRDTDSRLNALAGGRLFPGVHHHAQVESRETVDRLEIDVAADDGETRVHVKARLTQDWPADSIFASRDEASQFFAAGSLGYSATPRSGTFHGLELHCKTWHAEAMAVEEVRSSYFDDATIFPPGTIQLDNVLLMREIEHEWIGQTDLCCSADGYATDVDGGASPKPATTPTTEPIPAPGLATPAPSRTGGAFIKPPAWVTAATCNRLPGGVSCRAVAWPEAEKLRGVGSMSPFKLFAAVLVVGSSVVQAAAPAKRPNILFCFADDWGRYASVYAATESRPSPNQVVKTPNIDRVAREGALFKNAFVNAPSCTPCRSALLSGQYFFRTGRGAILHNAVWDADIPSFPNLLRDAGYHIGETYKVWSPGTPNDAPFGAGKHAFESAGGKYNNFSENATQMIKQGKTFDEARDLMLAEVRDNFDAFHKAREGDKPWLYWFGPTLVHRKWIKGSGKALWVIEPESLQGKLPAFLPDVPEIREDFADYLGEIQGWDAGIGVLLKRLEELGELDNTLIVISGDHGAPGFTHGKCNLYDFGTGVSLVARVPGVKGGRVLDDFVNLMDLAPTFCEAGGAAIPEVMTGRSLWSVLTSGGAGQVDTERNWVVTGRERHVGHVREDNLTYPHRALRTPDFLYIRNFHPERWPMGNPRDITDTYAPSQEALENETYAAFPDMDASPTKAWLVAHRNDPQWKKYYDYAFAKHPAEELYDLRKDPDQVTNVADDPAYASQKVELGTRLMAILLEAKDPRVVPPGDTFEKSPFTDPPPAEKQNRGQRKR
ncbi:MAG: sulfatase-like hydrolase/transferase [Pirellulales bacterium]